MPSSGLRKMLYLTIYQHMWQREWSHLLMKVDGVTKCCQCFGRCLPKYDRRNDHCGRCCSYLLFTFCEILCQGVADWIATVIIRVTYFNLSSGVLNRTSYQISERLYFSMFLLRDGPLILVYIDSFIVLARFWSSLLTILTLSTVVVWPVMLLLS